MAMLLIAAIVIALTFPPDMGLFWDEDVHNCTASSWRSITT